MEFLKNKWFLACVALFLFIVFMNITISYSQTSPNMGCKPLPTAAGIIEGLHKERIVFRGVSNRGHVTVIHLNKNTGTWSANVILPKNITQLCMVDAGTTGEITDTTFSPQNTIK